MAQGDSCCPHLELQLPAQLLSQARTGFGFPHTQGAFPPLHGMPRHKGGPLRAYVACTACSQQVESTCQLTTRQSGLAPSA